ncbi:hypothetical protein BDR26DRAFT_1004713 [Obelidium mucronatum]|nr:hypothetical protein BDR26DRAFT_1004713 [Obelidium mucronatum]
MNETQNLLKREQTVYLNHPAICTATFFEGENSFESAEAHLRARYSAILQVNPWLAGKLTKVGKETKLTYSSDAILTQSTINSVFETLSTPIDISPNTEYQALLNMCSPSTLAGDGNLNGHKQLKAGSRVSRLVLARTSQDSQFVVLFSMSHAIADGFTYYEILNMLSESAKIRALNPTRKLKYESLLPSLIGPHVLKFGGSLTFVKAYVMGMFRKPPAQALAFYVDDAKVKIAKEKCVGNGPFVSTNDILCAHFMKACSPIRLGMMAIQLSIKVSRNQLPGFFSKSPLAFISSWAIKGSQIPFDLALARQVLHLPLMYLGVPLAKCPMDTAIVFRPLPNKLAIMYFAKQCSPSKLLMPSDVNVLGESIRQINVS